jgi:hypothetical protein
MYLGHRKVKGRGYKSGITQEQIPAQIEPVILVGLVQQLRAGNPHVVKEIIGGHIGLVIQIVGRYVVYFPHKAEDMTGVALLATVEAVRLFEFCGTNDDITPYIVSNVHGKLANFLKEDSTVRMTQYGMKKVIDDAKLRELLPSDLLPMCHSLDAVKESRHKEPKQYKDIMGQCAITDHSPSNLEIEEIVDKVNFSRFEFMVFKFLMEGWTEADIARQMSYTRGRINQVKGVIIEKLAPFFKDELGDKDAAGA